MDLHNCIVILFKYRIDIFNYQYRPALPIPELGAALYAIVYGKTFRGENFCGFSANRKSFPLESLAVYST